MSAPTDTEKTTPTTDTVSGAEEQDAHDMLRFMGLKCDECDGLGWYEDIEAYHNGRHHCEQQVQRQCEKCNGTGEL